MLLDAFYGSRKMIPSRAWRLAIWFVTTLIGGIEGISVVNHDFIIFLAAWLVGSLVFGALLNEYYKARLQEDMAERKRKLVAAISGHGE